MAIRCHKAVLLSGLAVPLIQRDSPKARKPQGHARLGLGRQFRRKYWSSWKVERMSNICPRLEASTAASATCRLHAFLWYVACARTCMLVLCHPPRVVAACDSWPTCVSRITGAINCTYLYMVLYIQNMNHNAKMWKYNCMPFQKTAVRPPPSIFVSVLSVSHVCPCPNVWWTKRKNFPGLRVCAKAMAAAARVAWELCAMMFSASWRRLLRLCYLFLPVPSFPFFIPEMSTQYSQIDFSNARLWCLELKSQKQLTCKLTLGIVQGNLKRFQDDVLRICKNTSTPASQKESITTGKG